jgi:hypothetical protein
MTLTLEEKIASVSSQMSVFGFENNYVKVKNQFEALDRLIAIAKHDTGQAKRVANFLLAWWNATRDGGFDFTDLWNVDREIAVDMVTVFAMIAETWTYPDRLGYEDDFREIVTLWRRTKRRRKLASDE